MAVVFEALQRRAKHDLPEIKKLVMLGAPVFVALASNRSLSTISLSFVGGLGSAELAAAGLATSLANVTGESVLVGLSSALQTLCGQAFGAKAYKEVGNAAQRAVLVLWAVCLPLTALWWFSEPLLLMIGQDAEVSHLTCTFLRWRLPGIWAYALFASTQGFLQSQSIVMPPAYTNLLAAALHPLTTWVLMNKVGMGFQGAAAAYSVANVLQVALLLGVIISWKMHHKCWGGFSTKALQGWFTFVKLALPSMVMLGEWVASEIATVAAGRLPNPDAALSAMGIFQQTNALAFMLPLGLGIAVAVRTANEVGAGRPKEARHAASVAVRLSTLLGLFLGSTVLLARTKLVLVFSGEEEVISVASGVLSIMWAYIALDGIQCILGGIIRGTARQLYAAPVIVFSYYIVALPASLLLCFVFHYGVYGLCIGMFLGTLVNSVIYAWMCGRTNWEKCVLEAKQRSGKGAEDEEQPLLDGDAEEGQSRQ